MIVLPTEILIQIASYLDATDKIASLSTCHSWHEAFRYSLYHTISVKSFDQFKILHEALQVSLRDSIIPNGHAIKHLSVQSRKPICFQKKWPEPKLPYLLLESLPELCPNLESLDFDPTSWKMCVSYCTLDSWKRMRKIPTLACLNEAFLSLQYLGGTLTSITIESHILVDVSTHNRLSSIFSLTPYLEELTIRGERSEGPALKLNLLDIELLHSLLPKLKKLSIIGNTIQMPIGSDKLVAQQITRCLEASELRYLHWDTHHTPYIWLLYIAYKYSNLQHLQLDVHYDSHEILNKTSQIEEELFLNLVRKCRHIEILALSCPTMDRWLNLPFLTLLKGNQRLSQICFPIQKANQIKNDTQFKFVAEHISPFVTMLEIDQWRFNMNLSNTFRLLKSFQRLTYLKLKCDTYHHEYDLQYLLDVCPKLETLVLEWGTLLVPSPSGYENQIKKHRLAEIYLTFVAFETHLFDYLSRTCRSLKVLSMKKCKQLSDSNNMASQTVICLNMPHHDLDTIVLDGIRLDCSNTTMMCARLSSYIRIAHIQTENDIVWQQQMDTHDVEDDKLCTETLSPRNALAAQTYFDKRKQYPFIGTDKNIFETLPEQKMEDALKTNLIFGYVEIRCRKLRNFFFSSDTGFRRTR
ncbi:hypothetical protein BD560DRAFT_383562 [Blakeslea trispora]|nr:hypothetical protein BD560DRAFT_383562 [Blakeslea trispora]